MAFRFELVNEKAHWTGILDGTEIELSGDTVWACIKSDWDHRNPDIDTFAPRTDTLAKVLDEAHRDRKFVGRPDALAHAVANAWSIAGFSHEALTQPRWLDLFKEAGYAVDGHLAPEPTEPIRLYRGAPDDYRHGLAWTRDLSTARRFADGTEGRHVGTVWVADVPPANLLAFIHYGFEYEYIVDTAGVEIRPYEY